MESNCRNHSVISMRHCFLRLSCRVRSFATSAAITASAVFSVVGAFSVALCCQNEIDIMETIDYGDTDMRAEMEGGHRGSYNEEDSLGSMGYQKQEFDEDSEELINVDDEADEAEDFSFDGDGLDDSYDE